MHQTIKKLFVSGRTMAKIQAGQHPSSDKGITKHFGRSPLIKDIVEHKWDYFLFQSSVISYYGLTV